MSKILRAEQNFLQLKGQARVRIGMDPGRYEFRRVVSMNERGDQCENFQTESLLRSKFSHISIIYVSHTIQNGTNHSLEYFHTL
jgi:hypothetical protein